MVSVVLLKLAHGIAQHTAHCNKVRADVTVAGRAVVCAPIVHEAFAIICRTLGKHNLACTYFPKSHYICNKTEISIRNAECREFFVPYEDFGDIYLPHYNASFIACSNKA